MTGSVTGADAAFWQTKGGIALFTAVLGLAGSMIAGTYALVGSSMQLRSESALKNRELALTELKEDHTVEKEYFLKAVDSGNSPALRSRILRYLTVSPRVSPEMKDWAKSELQYVDTELKVQVQDLNHSIDGAQQALNQTQSDIASLKSTKEDDPTSVTLKKRREQEQDLLDKLKARSAETQSIVETLARAPAAATHTLSCRPGSVRAVSLGPDDPDQATADANCASSAVGRALEGNQHGQVSWVIRREGRNLQCQCDAQ